MPDVGFPLVLKPRELAGSVGVIKAPNVGRMTPENMFLVEEYILAQNEISAEVFNQGDFHRVLAVTDKYLGEEPYLLEVGHSVPSVHTDNARLIEIAERACQALEIKYGIALP